jgi:ABC-type dipeptide/oligopeptide/nickel transport system ATPase component
LSDAPPILDLRLSVDYREKPGVLEDVALRLRAGEILALVGESGSGKSTLSLAILRLLEMRGGTARGSILFDGRDLMVLSEREMRAVRGRDISLVLQSPHSSLNPALRIGTQLSEAWRAHASGSRDACRAAVAAAVRSVSLPDDPEFLRRFPGQLSVGQAQRVLIALAILHRPRLLLADEPTSALDVITQAEILDLFARLNRALGMAVLFISHDLLSVAALCHRIAILRNGRIIECDTTENIFLRPAHPYTRQLLDALPRNPFAAAERVT